MKCTRDRCERQSMAPGTRQKDKPRETATETESMDASERTNERARACIYKVFSSMQIGTLSVNQINN